MKTVNKKIKRLKSKIEKTRKDIVGYCLEVERDLEQKIKDIEKNLKNKQKNLKGQTESVFSEVKKTIAEKNKKEIAQDIKKSISEWGIYSAQNTSKKEIFILAPNKNIAAALAIKKKHVMKKKSLILTNITKKYLEERGLKTIFDIEKFEGKSIILNKNKQ